MIADGVAIGYQYVLDLASLDRPPPLDLTLIQELHRRSFGHIYDWAGKWRLVELESPAVAAPVVYVVERMKACVDDVAVRLQHLPVSGSSDYQARVIELVAWFQHRYVQVHPFRDFNGRTARMLSTYLLLQLGLPYVEIHAEEGTDRDVYIAAMRAADDYDHRPLQTLIERAVTEASLDAS